MKLNIYAIFDSCAGFYQHPFFGHADGEATRSFGDIAQDADHPIGTHPEHYSLWRLGTYDQSTAKINLEEKTCLATALELIALNKNPPADLLEAFDKQVQVEREAMKSPGGTA